MPLFPSITTLSATFPTAISQPRRETPPPLKSYSKYYPFASVTDDVKNKAHKLSDEAQRELAKASKATQAKTGQIELYSAKYYVACTIGGLMACVRSNLNNGF